MVSLAYVLGNLTIEIMYAQYFKICHKVKKLRKMCRQSHSKLLEYFLASVERNDFSWLSQVYINLKMGYHFPLLW